MAGLLDDVVVFEAHVGEGGSVPGDLTKGRRLQCVKCWERRSSPQDQFSPPV